jgi:hypothetical protein
MRAYLAGVTVISGLLALACGGGAEPDLEDPVLREPEPTDGEAPAYLDTDLSPALRAAMTPDFVEAHAVILWGSTDKAAAEAWLASYRGAGGPVHDGFPRIEDSGEIALLNPGFWIVLAALPEEAAVAAALVDGYKGLELEGVDTSGAYAREVRVPEPEYDLTATAVLPPAWRALVVWQGAEVEETSEDWGFFTGDVTDAADAAGVLTTSGGHEPAIRISREGEVLAELDASTFPADGIGYVFAMPGAEPEFHPHDMPSAVLSAASAYFGTDIAQ